MAEEAEDRQRSPAHRRLRQGAQDRRRFLNHASRRGIVDYNPFTSVPRLHGTGRGRREGGRPIEPREARHPRDIERIRLAMRGRGIPAPEPCARQPRRLGGLATEREPLSPSWARRDADGPLRYLSITGGIKDVAGQLLERPTKTTSRARRPVAGRRRGSSSSSTSYRDAARSTRSSSPTTSAATADWDNFRQRNWYRALHDAGLADAPTPTASGAFDPYGGRHTCATVMFHAVKPGENGGHYTPKEIARQLGNSPTCCTTCTSTSWTTQHGVAGLTMEEIIRTARAGRHSD